MIQKITNPNYLGIIAPLVMRFYKRVTDSSGIYEGITYETLFTYLTRLSQFGKGDPDRSEVWVAYNDDNKPVGFAAWHLMDLPYVGTVFCPCLFNDTRNQKSIKELYNEFIQFGRRHRAPLYKYHALNDKVANHFAFILDKLGVEVKDTGAKEFIGKER